MEGGCILGQEGLGINRIEKFLIEYAGKSAQMFVVHTALSA